MKTEVTETAFTMVKVTKEARGILRRIADKTGERIYRTVLRLAKAEAKALGLK